MAGAPSTLDMFDYKPKLNELNGQVCPESYVRGQQFAFLKGPPKLLGSPHRFAPRGRSGQVMSDVLPHLATVADDIAVVRSMYTDQFNHAPAQLFVHTGSARLGRPSMGSWLSYGLGTENRDLPSFVVLVSGTAAPDGGASLWGSAFLPTIHQGVQLRSLGRSGALPLQPRRHEPPSSAGGRSTRSRRSTGCSSRTWATPRSSPGSRSTRWPTRCRPACRS